MSDPSARSPMVVCVALLMLFATGAAAKPGDIEVTIMAADADWLANEYVGHAFMCISLHLNSGTKEDCFGFYPRNGGKGFIGTPGATVSEFRKNPDRFAKVVISISRLISEEQRRSLLALANDWSGKEYDLVGKNCVSFVNAVAQAVGWKTPELKVGELPKDHLRRLKDMNP